MNTLLEKLNSQLERMEKVKGTFNFFALMLKEGKPNTWDLLVKAEWVKKDNPSAINYIQANLKQALNQEELSRIDKVVILKDDPIEIALNILLCTILRSKGARMAEFRNIDISGTKIRHLYLIKFVCINEVEDQENMFSGVYDGAGHTINI